MINTEVQDILLLKHKGFYEMTSHITLIRVNHQTINSISSSWDLHEYNGGDWLLPWPGNGHLACDFFVSPQIIQINSRLYFNTLWTGDADLRLCITTVQDGWRKSAFFDMRLVSMYITLHYAIHGACLQMVPLTDVYRNVTSLRFNDLR
jgi:hypothetical protein